MTLWVQSLPETCLRKGSPGSSDQAGAGEADALAVVNRLAALGYFTTTSRLVTVLYAHLPPAVIRQVAQWDEVLTVYLVAGPYRPAAP